MKNAVSSLIFLAGIPLLTGVESTILAMRRIVVHWLVVALLTITLVVPVIRVLIAIVSSAHLGRVVVLVVVMAITVVVRMAVVNQFVVHHLVELLSLGLGSW